MIHVATHSHHRSDSLQSLEYVRIADVTRMQNVITADQLIFDFRSKQAVGVGNHTDCY